jgi:hypothetical protein
MSHVEYDMLPGLVEEAQDFVERGIEPDRRDFLYELLTNDLVGVFRFGDNANLAELKTWVEWLYWQVPSQAWGSEAKVRAWCESGGLDSRGIEVVVS